MSHSPHHPNAQRSAQQFVNSLLLSLAGLDDMQPLLPDEPSPTVVDAALLLHLPSRVTCGHCHLVTPTASGSCTNCDTAILYFEPVAEG